MLMFRKLAIVDERSLLPANHDVTTNVHLNSHAKIMIGVASQPWKYVFSVLDLYVDQKLTAIIPIFIHPKWISFQLFDGAIKPVCFARAMHS